MKTNKVIEDIIKELDDKFIFEGDDNMPGILYKINDDGSKIIAQPEDLNSAIRQALAQVREQIIIEARKELLADLFILRDAVDKKPSEVFKEEFIDFVGSIDNLSHSY